MRARVGTERFAPHEAALVGYARQLGHRSFVRALGYWEQVADPDGADRHAHCQREGRRVHLSQTLEGMWVLDGEVDPINGGAVSKALRAVEEQLFATDWAEARERLGDTVSAADLARTSAQRRADALVELAHRAMATPQGSRRPEPLVTVLVGYETFAGRVCELASGTAVAPAALLPWLTEAVVERVVFEGPDRIRNVGVRRRLFDGATRRAVQVRDRECFSPFCDRPADECDVDHVVPYSEGGLTVDGNGRPACPFHNRLRNRPP